jgi:protease-4
MDGFGFTGLMDKLGVQRRLYTSGANKGMLDPFSPEVPRQKGYAESMLKEIHQQFIDVVKEGRGDRLKNDPELFSGLFWSGERAVELGLADGLGSADYVARTCSRPRTSSTTRSRRTSPNAWPSASARLLDRRP